MSERQTKSQNVWWAHSIPSREVVFSRGVFYRFQASCEPSVAKPNGDQSQGQETKDQPKSHPASGHWDGCSRFLGGQELLTCRGTHGELCWNTAATSQVESASRMLKALEP